MQRLAARRPDIFHVCMGDQRQSGARGGYASLLSFIGSEKERTHCGSHLSIKSNPSL